MKRLPTPGGRAKQPGKKGTFRRDTDLIWTRRQALRERSFVYSCKSASVGLEPGRRTKRGGRSIIRKKKTNSKKRSSLPPGGTHPPGAEHLRKERPRKEKRFSGGGTFFDHYGRIVWRRMFPSPRLLMKPRHYPSFSKGEKGEGREKLSGGTSPLERWKGNHFHEASRHVFY